MSVGNAKITWEPFPGYNDGYEFYVKRNDSEWNKENAETLNVTEFTIENIYQEDTIRMCVIFNNNSGQSGTPGVFKLQEYGENFTFVFERNLNSGEIQEVDNAALASISPTGFGCLVIIAAYNFFKTAWNAVAGYYGY